MSVERSIMGRESRDTAYAHFTTEEQIQFVSYLHYTIAIDAFRAWLWTGAMLRYPLIAGSVTLSDSCTGSEIHQQKEQGMPYFVISSSCFQDGRKYAILFRNPM